MVPGCPGGSRRARAVGGGMQRAARNPGRAGHLRRERGRQLLSDDGRRRRRGRGRRRFTRADVPAHRARLSRHAADRRLRRSSRDGELPGTAPRSAGRVERRRRRRRGRGRRLRERRRGAGDRVRAGERLPGSRRRPVRRADSRRGRALLLPGTPGRRHVRRRERDGRPRPRLDRPARAHPRRVRHTARRGGALARRHGAGGDGRRPSRRRRGWPSSRTCTSPRPAPRSIRTTAPWTRTATSGSRPSRARR